MSERRDVTCPCGRQFATAVRGRGTHCPECGKRLYVRVDGTLGAGARGAAPAAGRPGAKRQASGAVAAAPAAPTEADAAAAERVDFVSLDDILDDDAPERVIEARSIWELSRTTAEGPGLSVRELSAEFRVSEATVRRRIAEEEARQEAERAAAPPGGSRSTSPSSSPAGRKTR